MGARSKSGKPRGTAQRIAAKRRQRQAVRREPWEQDARGPDAFDYEIDCQRIVQGEAGRSLPVYYDEYN